MSTSLREQLLRLQTPQSSLFVDSKKRDSILFSAKDAATKSRETIYEIGLSGLKELMEMDVSFAEFEGTLFNITARDVQRAVETTEVNKLLNKNLKRFMLHLSPYFMIPASHKCLEWLIRRFNINLYNREELLMLILPYHQTNMFVRCVQTMKFSDSTDKWSFLAEVKKSCSPLSKITLWNHGASQPAFLDFVGKFTYDAVKEFDYNAGKLQTMFSFYFTTCVGALEHASKINDNHILAISKYLIKTYKSTVVDYTAAGYMITAQLVSKTILAPKLLYELMDKMTKSIGGKLARDCLLLLALIFQTQSDELKITDKILENLLEFKKILIVLKQIKNEDKIITEFYKALIYKLLIKLQEKDEYFQNYCEICEKMLQEIDMDDELACVIIRTVLDSYVQENTEIEAGKSYRDESEVISLDSDDENIPLKSQDITKWYSSLLKKLERQYPTAFDLVVKAVMTSNPQRKRNGLRNVLGFLMNVSCSNNDTNVFENLYHHNPHVRSEAVTYLVKNLKKIEQTPENSEILKMTLSERLSDDAADVVSEILKMDSQFLTAIIGVDELVAKLSRIIMKYWRNNKRWEDSASLALKMLATINKSSDSNVVILSVLPFMFPCNTNAKLFPVKKSSSAVYSIIHQMLADHAKMPSSDSLLSTIQSVLINNNRVGIFSENFAFYLLSCSLATSVNDPEFSLKAFEAVRKIATMPKVKFSEMDVNDVDIMKGLEISIKLLSQVLIALINSTNFTTHNINFSHQNIEAKLSVDLFKFIIELFFAIDSSYRGYVNDIMIALLDKISQSDEAKKLQFFSQFCALHAAATDNTLEFQIRAMGLFNHVLKTGQVKVKSYSNEMFQNVLISLASPVAKTREFGMDILSTLQSQSIAANWKFVLEKLISRKEEILMDCEQIKMIIYLLSSKKNSKYVQEVIDTILTRIGDPSTFDYIQSELMMLLKYFSDRKVLDVSMQVASKIIGELPGDTCFFNDNHSAIVKLVLMKFNTATVSILWNLALKALKCHHVMNDEGKIITPSMLVLQSINNELFVKLHPSHKLALFSAIIECSMNEQARIIQTAQKVFFNISLDYKIIQSAIDKLPRCLDKDGVRASTLDDWKFGVTVLELLQNKTEGTGGQHDLLPILFDTLSACLKPSDETEIEYVKQIVLSLILTICKTISPDGSGHRSKNISDSVFKTDLVIKCIKESQNPQTHHHALLLLAHLALMIPEQVLRDITTIFTFVGTALVRLDDSYSFQIITKIIENIIPNLLRNGQKKEVLAILKTFATIALDVPVHRRMLLYVKLLETLNAEKHLWMFIASILEVQVTQPKKSKEEDLPERLQTALAITKEFDLKTVIVSTTSLIVYLKELPVSIDTNKLKQAPRGSMDDEIFPLETHSNKNLRHFKYLITLFVKHILESPEISSKTYQLGVEQIHGMKAHFQNLILNTLIWLPDVNKSIEMKQNEVFWQLILQIYFDILEATIALLAPDMLLIVVERLVDHENLIVRKKVLELLNRKLEDSYFKACSDEKVLKMMAPLKNVCETIGMEGVSPQEESVQQLALVSVKLLAKILSEEHPENFIECLNHLTIVMSSQNLRKSTMINLIDCVAELINDLRVHSISLLGKVMPNLVDLLRRPELSSYNLLYTVVSSLQRIIEAVPLFMSPYLVQVITELIKIAPQLKTAQDTKVSYIVAKIKKIWESMSQTIPLRVLYPSIDEIYDSINQKRQFNSIEPLMEFMYEIFKHAETKDIRDYQAEMSEFFLKAVRFRCELASECPLKLSEINDIELFIIRALIALILKLSEGSFRPLFENISNWAIKDKEDDESRLITFFRVTNELSAALKSLFLLFASDTVDCAAQLLDKCNPSKQHATGDLCFGADTEKNLYLVENILRTLHNMFLNDHQNFIDSRRFEIIMQPIVDQMENEDALSSESIQQLIRMCVAQLAVAVSDDILWKQLNYQVLLKTRSDNSSIRILGVRACVDVARKLTEDFEALVPETIPFLSELLEDEDHNVVEACQNSIREMETIVGESLQKYF